MTVLLFILPTWVKKTKKQLEHNKEHFKEEVLSNTMCWNIL